MADFVFKMNLRRFYDTTNLQLFIRLVEVIGKPFEVVKMVMAVWFLLENLTSQYLMKKLDWLADPVLAEIFNETLICFDCTNPGTISCPTMPIADTPLLAQLIGIQINSRYFFYHRDFLRSELDRIATLSDIIFAKLSLSVVSDLNPFAAPFFMTAQKGRSLYITFSKGFPCTLKELLDFFSRNWGFVEKLIFEDHPRKEKESGSSNPDFGILVFTNTWIIDVVLDHQETAKFCVNGKQIRARKFVPKNRNRRWKYIVRSGHQSCPQTNTGNAPTDTSNIQ